MVGRLGMKSLVNSKFPIEQTVCIYIPKEIMMNAAHNGFTHMHYNPENFTYFFSANEYEPNCEKVF